MKITGWIFLIIGVLACLGALLRGHSITGPIFWSGLGVYLIHRSNQKKQEEKDKQDWFNTNKNDNE